MRVTSNVFYEMARALGLTRPDASGTDIDVPPQFQGVITPRSPLDNIPITGLAAIQRSTFQASGLLDVNAGSGTVDTQLAALGKGLWEINLMMSMTSNYLGLNLFDAFIYLTEPGGPVNTFYLLGMRANGAAAAPLSLWGTRTITIALTQDGMQLRQQAVNNAAGQRITAGLEVVCQKLA